VRGGSELGALSLSRFFAVHTHILPWTLALLAGLHIFLLERAGAGGTWNEGKRDPSRSEPLFPDQIFKDARFILVIFLALSAFALFSPAPLEPQADPTDSTYNPRPEWYFYFVFEMLRIFEGPFEVVGTVVLPAAAVLVLVLIPFLDRSAERDPAKRKFMLSGAGVVVAAVLALTIAGARAPMVIVPAVTAESVLAGRAVYARSGCSGCHAIHGKGGSIGPDLTHVGTRKPDAEWHIRHLKDPRSMVPGSIMPKIDLSDRELNELADYMLSLK
jgi:ubiquinol-cytochrome c reductase cytochrome b subunit